MARQEKTNAVRMLEAAGIEFETRSYDTDEHLDAVSVAEKIGESPERVFKTLVTVNDKRENFVFVVPGNCSLDLKKAAKVSGSKYIEMIKMDLLLPLTGYIRGGCSPVGMKRQFPVFIAEEAQLFESVFVSAGVRGMQILIRPDDLIKITGGEFADLI